MYLVLVGFELIENGINIVFEDFVGCVSQIYLQFVVVLSEEGIVEEIICDYIVMNVIWCEYICNCFGWSIVIIDVDIEVVLLGVVGVFVDIQVLVFEIIIVVLFECVVEVMVIVEEISIYCSIDWFFEVVICYFVL